MPSRDREKSPSPKQHETNPKGSQGSQSTRGDHRSEDDQPRDSQGHFTGGSGTGKDKETSEGIEEDEGEEEEE
jgi:hypothetical protein